MSHKMFVYNEMTPSTTQTDTQARRVVSCRVGRGITN